MHRQPSTRGGGRTSAGAGRAPSLLQVGSCTGRNRSVWAGGGGPWPSGGNVNFCTLAGGPLDSMGQEVS